MSIAGMLVMAGTAIGLTRALPQLIRLLRTRDAHGVSADSAGTTSVMSVGWAGGVACPRRLVSATSTW